jgi:hypothetical protein
MNLVLNVLSGDAPLKMNVIGFPVNEEFIAKEMALRDAFHELLDGKRSLPIAVPQNDSGPVPPATGSRST